MTPTPTATERAAKVLCDIFESALEGWPQSPQDAIAEAISAAEEDSRREERERICAFIVSPELHRQCGGRATAAEMVEEIRKRGEATKPRAADPQA